MEETFDVHRLKMFMTENILSKIGNISHIGLVQYDPYQNFSLFFLSKTGK